MRHRNAPLMFTPAFKIIGHRGVAALRPENTIASFRYAAKLGLNCVEFDTQLTSCKQWVVFHDENVERITNGIGKLTELSLIELKQLDAGTKFAAEYSGEQIPTLLETLEELTKLGVQANIEVKLFPGIDPIAYADLLVEFIKKNTKLLSPPPLISCFDLTLLQRLRDLMPDIAIGYLVEKFSTDTIDIANQHNFNAIHCDVKTIKPEDLTTARKHNLPVLLYTINDADVAKHWLQQGVYAVFSDHPGRIMTKSKL